MAGTAEALAGTIPVIIVGGVAMSAAERERMRAKERRDKRRKKPRRSNRRRFR